MCSRFADLARGPLGWLLLGASGALIALMSCDSNRQIDSGISLDGGPDSGPEVDGDADSDRDADSDEGDADGAICDEMALSVLRVTPRVLIVLDRSNSMLFDGHWRPVSEALIEVTRALQSRIAFGLMVFPRADGRRACGHGENECEPASAPSVSCRARAAGAIRGVLESTDPCGGTPTAPTLQAAAETFREPPPLDHVPSSAVALGYVVLATDGAPNCNEDLDGAGCRCTDRVGSCEDFSLNCLDDERTYEAIESLQEVDVRVYVLGISASDWVDVLDEMALRGGTEAAYMVEEASEFQEALESITEGLTTCEVVLSDPSPVADPELVNLYIEGERVPQDGEGECQEGWSWADEDHDRVVFCGSWCDRLKAGEIDEVTATFGCPTLI